MIVTLGIILIFGYGVFKNIFQKSTKLNIVALFLPDYLPNGIKPLGPVQLQRDSGKDLYVIGYGVSDRDDLVLSQQLDNQYKCYPPDPNSVNLTDYKTFKLINGDEGCAVTGFNKERIFNWFNGDNRYILKTKDLTIGDDEIIKIANSLQLKSVEVE